MKKFLWTIQGNARGFSLLEILIGISISATALYFIQDKLGESMKAGKRVSLMQTKTSAETYIKTHVSCANSYTGPCTPNATVSLKDSGGNDAVSAATGKKLGELTIKAMCNSSGDGFVARVAWLKPTGALNSTSDDQFFKDPLTKKPFNWNHISSKLFDGENICPSPTGSQTSWCASSDHCVGSAIICISLTSGSISTGTINWNSTYDLWVGSSGACDGGVLVRQ